MKVKSGKKGGSAGEPKRMKRRLSIREDWKEKYKSLVKASPDAVTLTDLDGNIIELSPRTLRLHGYRRAGELLGKSAFDLIAPQDRKRAASNIKKTMKQGYMRGTELTMVKKDGGFFFAELDAALIKDAGGKPLSFIATVRDITERKRGERALKRSEERYRSLFALSPQAVVTLNMKGVITSCNPAAVKMTGYEEEELAGKNALKLGSLMKKDLPRFQKILSSLVKGRAPEPFECAFFHKDGTKSWAFVNVGLFDEGSGKKGIQVAIADISRHKKTEMALRESEQRYKALFDRSLYGVFVHDFEGRLLDANKAALNLAGYKEEGIPKVNLSTLLDEDQLLTARECLDEIKKLGYQREPTQYRLTRTDGGEVWVETEASLLCQAGVPYGILEIARDITEQKRAGQALRESEKKYRTIFESLSDVYYRTDRQGRVTEISPSVRRQAGYDPEDVIGHPVTDFYQDPSAWKEFDRRLRKSGSVNDYELRLKGKDGRVFDVSVSSQIVLDERGNAIGVEGVLRDITARKRAEDALRESEEKFRTMVENSLQGLIILQDDRIVYANEALARILGFDLEELLALPPEKIYELVHPAEREMIWSRMADRLEGKEVPSRYEFRVFGKEGSTIWLELVSNRIEYQGEPALLGAVIDVTEHKQAEERIRASLGEKEVMLREIHHRVKNNMQIILSLLRIQSRSIPERKTREMFKQSQNRIRSMALIHETLYKSGDLANIDFTDYIARMGTHLLSIYKEELGDVSISQEAEGVFLDINRAIPCGLLISELLSNALKHAFPMKKKGKVVIKMSKDKRNKYFLMVKDTGVGFPEGLDFRATETLGLQLVGDLVHQLRGSIELKKGPGTEFVVRFRA
jgi:PAS domain S-box-containing protein